MACSDDLVGRVLHSGFGDGVPGALCNLIPGITEARVNSTVLDIGTTRLAKVDVCKPVTNVAAASDREDNLLADVVS